MTIVSQAVCRNNLQTVKFLVECGVDTSVTDLYGQTPLQNAQMFENIGMTRILESTEKKRSDTADALSQRDGSTCD